MKTTSVLLLLVSCCAFAQQPDRCGALKLSLPNVRIVNATAVSAGEFRPAEQVPPEGLAVLKSLPAFCRLQAEATPSADSSIAIEVWLPLTGWNGRFQGLGNGGFAGDINYETLSRFVRQGYAVAATNTGHSGSPIDASWALGHPEKIADFGHRAVHQMTLVGQAATKAFYGKSQQHSYFLGCSNGGRAALMEAQRYPDDYDGIVAGAPANYWTHLLTNAIWNAQATAAKPDSYIPSVKLPTIAEAVNKSCDAQDGVTDGVLNDPRACRFDPAVLQCKADDSGQCLTAPQVTALQKLYEGAHDANGRQIFPGYVPGAELGEGGWALWITGPAPERSLMFAFGNGYFSNMVYDNRKWDFRSANIDDLVKDADAKTASMLNSTDPNLSAFKAHGGKLLIYHGWNDPAISALNTIDYFNSVVARMGESSVDSFVRLYMVPGLQHCGGGVGATDFGQGDRGFGQGNETRDAQHNIALALEEWVEEGHAPSTIIARKPGASPTMTRPLCPFPQEAKYKGSGETNDAANFSCAKR